MEVKVLNCLLNFRFLICLRSELCKWCFTFILSVISGLWDLDGFCGLASSSLFVEVSFFKFMAVGSF